MTAHFCVPSQTAFMSSTSYGKIILTETKEISGRKFPIAPKEIQNKIPRCFAQEEHNEILLSLSLTDSVPIYMGGWFSIEEGIPMKNLNGVFRPSLNALDKNYEVSKISKYDIEKSVVPFLELKKDIKDRLAIPLTRLNRAIRPRSPVDKAIDIGIALESLFFSDSGKMDQISYTFRLRGAWLLGVNSEKRKILIQIFQRLYDCRSKAVHSGMLSDKIKIKGQKPFDSVRFLDIGIKACKLAIEQIINNKFFPDWDEITLGVPFTGNSEVQDKVERLLENLAKG